MSRRYYQLGGIGLLILAFILFIVMLQNLLLPRPTGTILTRIMVNGQPKLFRIDVANERIEPFSAEAFVSGHQVMLSPDGQRIAFWESSGNVIRINIANIDGSNRQVLTTGPRDFDPHWSPDGQQIVFVRYLTHSSAIFAVEVATGTEQQLTDFTNDLEPDWSPDGKRLVFTTSRDGFQELYTMNPDGGDLQRLTENENQNDLEAVYSPDGAHIAYMSNYSVSDGTGEIWLMNADGSNQRQLTDNDRDDRWPLWSSDSTRLIFTSSTGNGSESNTVLYDLKSNQLTTLTEPDDTAYFPLWSPDDRWILFVRGPRPMSSLYIMHPDGSGLQPLSLDSDLEIDIPILWMD